MRILVFASTITLALIATSGMASGAPVPEEVFAEMRRLQAEQRFSECAAVGREAAPMLVDMDVVWYVIAQCEQAQGKWCEANESVNRFLVKSEGASATRIADAYKLAGESLEHCDADRATRDCIGAFDEGDWQACVASCPAVDAKRLPRPKIAMLVHCLLEVGNCEDAQRFVLDEDVASLEPGDSERIEHCTRKEDPQVPVDETRGAGPGPWLLGLGAAAVVTGAVFLFLADANASDLNALPLSPAYDADYDALASSYRRNSTIGHVSMWGGLVLAGAGLVLVLTDEQSPEVGARVAPSFAFDRFALTLSGGF